MADPKLKAILLQSYREEAAELLKTIQDGFRDLGSATTPEKLTELNTSLCRACHSFKGAARAVEQPEVESLASLLEEKFRSAARPERCSFSGPHLGVLASAIDCLKELVETDTTSKSLPELLNGLEGVEAVAPQAPAAVEPAAKQPAPKLSLKETLLNAFAEESGQLLPEVHKSWADFKKAQTPEQVQTLAQELFRSFHTLKGGARAVELPEVEMLTQTLEEKFRAVSRLERPANLASSWPLLDQSLTYLTQLLPGGAGLGEGLLPGHLEALEKIPLEEAPKTVAPAVFDPRAIVREAFCEEQEPLMEELCTSIEGMLSSRESKDAEGCLQVACRASHSLKGAARAIELPEAELLAAALEETLRKALKAKKFFFYPNARQALDPTLTCLRQHIDHFVQSTPVTHSFSLENLVADLGRLESTTEPTTLEIAVEPETRTQASVAARPPSAINKLFSRRLNDFQENLQHQTHSLLQAQSQISQLTELTLQLESTLGAESAEKLARLRSGLLCLDDHLGGLLLTAQEDGDAFRTLRLEVSRRLLLPEAIRRRGLLCTVDGRQYFCPSEAVVEVVSLAELKDNTCPLVSLDASEQTRSCGVVLKLASKRAILTVDSVGGVQEIQVQQAGWPLEKIPGYEGFSVIGRRQAVPVLDLEYLVRHSGGPAFDEGEERPKQTRVLLVDDSLTSRQLLKAVLEGAGYLVQATVHGQQAYDTLIHPESNFDILVSDVEMPKMTGLELIEEVRKIERFVRFPVVLISTLDSAEHRKKGLSAGADAYVAKGDFNSTMLVDTMEQLLKEREAQKAL